MHTFYSTDQRVAGARGRGRSSSNSPILLNRERNLSEPLRRQEETSTSKLLPPLAHVPAEDKPVVNLQYILTIENKLWSILESLRIGNASWKLCQEYWEISEESPMPMLETLFREERTKKTIRKVCVIEVTALAFCNFCFRGDMPPDLLQQFRNLVYYVHQNFLSCMKLLLFRVGANASNNSWVDFVKETIKEKQVSVIQKGAQSAFMRQHCDVATRVLETLGRVVTGPIQRCLFAILHSLSSMDFVRARNVLATVIGNMPTTPDVIEEPLELVDASLPPQISERFTLVLDLDETLVHYLDAGEDSKLLVRPGCTEFIEEMGQYYELVIFTAALQDYADWAIDLIDPQGVIQYRLYRQHTIPTGPVFVKDLSRLGRDLRRTIIVDNVADNFKLQPDNGIYMKSWFDDEDDKCLLDLIPLLREISVQQVDDVRLALRSVRDQVLRQLVKGVANPFANFQATH